MLHLIAALYRDFGKHGSKNVCVVTYTVRFVDGRLFFTYDSHSTCEDGKSCYHDGGCGYAYGYWAEQPKPAPLYTFEECLQSF